MRKIGLLYICTILLLSNYQTPINADVIKPHVAGESAILIEGATGQILFSKLSDRSLSPASITKLMTTLLVLETLAPNDTITFSRNAVISIERGSSHIGMREDETITVNDALHGLLLESANEVANGLAEEVSGTVDDFVAKMNERAVKLGALNTNFVNPHGLYDEDQVTTAYDMALIIKALLEHDYFLEIMSHPTYQIGPTNLVDETRFLSQSHKMLNPKKGTTHYREDVIAGKSGYTIKSGHTLVTVAKNEDRTLIAVVLKTDADHLYTDTHALLDYGFETYNMVSHSDNHYNYICNLTQNGEKIGTVNSTTIREVTFLLPKSASIEDISYLKSMPESMEAPTAIGDVMGTIELYLDDQHLATTDILVTNVIEDSVMAQEVENTDDKISTDEQATTPKTNIPLWPFFLIIAIIGILITLYFLNKRQTMSYRDYKKMRDSQRGIKDSSI